MKIFYFIILLSLLPSIATSDPQDFDLNNNAEYRHGIKFSWTPLKSHDFKKFTESKIFNLGNRQTLEDRGFFVSVFEITQENWKNITGESFADYLSRMKKNTGGNPPIHLGDKKPVYYLDFESADNFVQRLNELEEEKIGESRWRFFIPSEIEWEFAARGGVKSEYQTGDILMPNAAVFAYYAVGMDTSNFPAEWFRQLREVGPVDGPSEVGSRSIKNNYGLYDVHGNVSELTATAVDNNDIIEIFPELDGITLHVRKGGAWHSAMDGCEFSLSSWTGEKFGRVETGLRIIAYQIKTDE